MGVTGTESPAHESTTNTPIKSPPPPPPPPPPPQQQPLNPNEVLELVKCDCCGLTEECTLTYISKVQETHQGKWICGLCSEAVKDEISRSSDETITIEEALKLHLNFCKKFKCLSSSPPPNPTKHLLSAMKHLLRRSLGSPPTRVLVRSNSSTSNKNSDHNGVHLTRSGSCFSTLAR